MEIDTRNPNQCTGSPINDCRLFIHPDPDRYIHLAVGGEPSLFARRVMIKDDDDNKARVISEVTWKNKDKEVSFELSTLIMNQANIPTE